MTNAFRKDVLWLLIISAVLTSFSSIALGLHSFYPFDGRMMRGTLYLASYLFTFALIDVYLAIRLGKYKATLMCKVIGIYTFIFFPILLIISTLLGFIIPTEISFWNFYLVIILCGVNIIYQSIMIFYISNRLINENKGYVAMKSVSWMSIGITSSLLLYYLSAFAKIWFIDINGKDIYEAIKPGYYIISAVEIMVMILVSVWILYVGYSCFLSGKTNNLVDLRHNVKFTRKVYKKYHVSFYLGIVGTFLMFVVALIASVRFLRQYLSLMALYLSMLLIRIPVHYYDVHVDKKYKDDDKTIYNHKHATLIYTGIILLLYASIVIVFGSSSQTKILSDNSFLAILIIFIPYTIARLVIFISKYRNYKKSYNPTLLSSFYVDIVMVLFTLTNVIIMIGIEIKYYILILIAMVITIGLILYCIAIAIYLIIIGICGLNNKREKQYQKYLELKGNDDSALDEE